MNLDIILFIAGIIIGYITNVIVSNKDRKKDLKRDRENYIMMFAKYILEVSIRLRKAIKTSELSKFEEVSNYIRNNQIIREKEFKFDTIRSLYIDKSDDELSELIGKLVIYIDYSRYKKNRDSFYLANKNKIEESINEHLKEFEQICFDLTNYSHYILLGIDKNDSQ